jgi:hypothetical protein
MPNNTSIMQNIDYFPGLNFYNVDLYKKYDLNSMENDLNSNKKKSVFEIIKNDFNQLTNQKIKTKADLYLPTEYILGFINCMKIENLICNDHIYDNLSEMITYNFDTNDIFIDNLKYNTILNNCIKNVNNDNILLPIGLINSNKWGHFVLIYINKNLKVIEFYDSSAGRWFKDNMIYIVPEMICDKIKEIFDLHDYKINVPYKSCPINIIQGIQIYETTQQRYSSSSFLCGIWGLLLLYLRIQNHNKTFIDLENILIDTAKKHKLYISDYAHKFLIFIYKIVKKMYKKYNIMIKNENPNYLRGHYNILEGLSGKNSHEIDGFIENLLNEYVEVFLDNKENNKNKKINSLEIKMNNLFALVKKKDFDTVFSNHITNILKKVHDRGYKKAYTSITY